MQIAHRKIGENVPPFMIAEMSGNHSQNFERGLDVDAGAKASAHALKLQTYTADTMPFYLSAGGFFMPEPNPIWNGAFLEIYVLL